MSMNIGETARSSGVSAKMIRHYEEIGLIPKANRTDSGYRQYNGNDVHTLRFIRQARNLGFSIRQIEELLGLWRNQRRPSRKVKALALAHVEELDARIRELEAMKQTLQELAAHCHGDERPECPILDGLAAPGTVADPGAARRDVPRRLARAPKRASCH
ncbi:MAG: Cu(I)-responsive transcriptional regulator [Betaproteobacteria bacterium RIFCSPLOWO2_02_FULL_66_14]|nr:MAG: Cu(I)-responsive transcriptional regulator [Betaproteobacteria bacterium RIFCSPLOWO2_02_FULL_66_14]